MKKFIKNIDTAVQGNTTYEQFKYLYPGKKNYVFSENAGTQSQKNVIFVKGT